jgi:hypothetical protein
MHSLGRCREERAPAHDPLAAHALARQVGAQNERHSRPQKPPTQCVALSVSLVVPLKPTQTAISMQQVVAQLGEQLDRCGGQPLEHCVGQVTA